MSVKSLRRAWIALTSSLVSALLLGLAASAAPAPVESQRRLRATLVITQAAIPRDLSEAALLRFARGHASKITATTAPRPAPAGAGRGAGTPCRKRRCSRRMKRADCAKAKLARPSGSAFSRVR